MCMSTTKRDLNCDGKNTDTESNWIIVVCAGGSFDACLSNVLKLNHLEKKVLDFSKTKCQNVTDITQNS